MLHAKGGLVAVRNEIIIVNLFLEDRNAIESVDLKVLKEIPSPANQRQYHQRRRKRTSTIIFGLRFAALCGEEDGDGANPAKVLRSVKTWFGQGIGKSPLSLDRTCINRFVSVGAKKSDTSREMFRRTRAGCPAMSARSPDAPYALPNRRKSTESV